MGGGGRGAAGPLTRAVLYVLTAAVVINPSHAFGPSFRGDQRVSDDRCSSDDSMRFIASPAKFVGAGGPAYGSWTKILTYPATRELEVLCIVWGGFDDAGPCSRGGVYNATFRGFLCAEDIGPPRSECEPVQWYRQDAARIDLFTRRKGNKTTWSLYYDSSAHPDACFPRRIHAKSVFDYPERLEGEDDDVGRWSLVAAIIAGLLLIILVVVVLNLRRVIRRYFPELLQSQMQRHDMKAELYKQDAEVRLAEKEAAVADGRAVSPPRKSNYVYMV